MADPRTSIISQRLSSVARIIAVSSGKGGVGKSLVATTLALTLAEQGYRTGLFDLDFTSPSTHLILGAKNLQPKEDRGLIPPKVEGIEYMSLVYYVHDEASPLRGEDTSNALIEMLAVTLWGPLDYLILDMPPGIGDAVLDLVRLVKRVEFLIVTTPSQLAFETVKKLSSLLKELRIPIIGVAENMKMTEEQTVKQQTEKLGLNYLTEIRYDSQVEKAIGDKARLLQTSVGKKAKEIVEKIVKSIKTDKQCTSKQY